MGPRGLQLHALEPLREQVAYPSEVPAGQGVEGFRERPEFAARPLADLGRRVGCMKDGREVAHEPGCRDTRGCAVARPFPRGQKPVDLFDCETE